jgi:hypothetical protein
VSGTYRQYREGRRGPNTWKSGEHAQHRNRLFGPPNPAIVRLDLPNPRERADLLCFWARMDPRHPSHAHLCLHIRFMIVPSRFTQCSTKSCCAGVGSSRGRSLSQLRRALEVQVVEQPRGQSGCKVAPFRGNWPFHSDALGSASRTCRAGQFK